MRMFAPDRFPGVELANRHHAVLTIERIDGNLRWKPGAIAAPPGRFAAPRFVARDHWTQRLRQCRIERVEARILPYDTTIASQNYNPKRQGIEGGVKQSRSIC